MALEVEEEVTGITEKIIHTKVRTTMERDGRVVAEVGAVVRIRKTVITIAVQVGVNRIG